MNDSRVGRYILLFWGALDAVYLLKYVINGLMNQRIPYVTDFQSTLVLLTDHGVFAAVLVIASWLLQLSILVSCAALLLQKKFSKYLIYLQTPFRVLFIIPSLSLLSFFYPSSVSMNAVLLVIMIATEVLKVWSVKKYA